MADKKKLVVIGNGMAGASAVEEILARVVGSNDVAEPYDYVIIATGSIKSKGPPPRTATPGKKRMRQPSPNQFASLLPIVQ